MHYMSSNLSKLSEHPPNQSGVKLSKRFVVGGCIITIDFKDDAQTV